MLDKHLSIKDNVLYSRQTCQISAYCNNQREEGGQQMTRQTSKRLAGCALYIAIVIVPSAAFADLRLVPGLNSPQLAAANAITAVCPTLVANAATLNSVQLELRNVCRAMIQTSNAQQASGPTAFSLNISPDQLASALQAVANEETITQGSSVIEARANLRVLGARLADLRAGAGGLRVSGLPGQKPLALLSGSAEAIGRNERGGGASTDLGGRLSGFINVNRNWGDKDATAREDAFDFTNYGAVVGADYRFRDSFVAGAAVNYSRTEADITSGGGGETENKTYGFSLYGSFYQGPWYVDASANYSRAKFDTSRNVFIPSNNPAVLLPIVRTATGSTDGDQYSFGVGSGYKYSQGPWTMTPYARLDYIRLSIDAYDESGSSSLDIRVDSQELTSLQSALGAQFAYTISTATGVVIPQISLEWNHEFRNKQRTVTARYVNDPFGLSNFFIPTNDPDRNFFTLGVGVSAVFKQGFSAFLTYERVLGLSLVTANSVVGGVRKEF